MDTNPRQAAELKPEVHVDDLTPGNPDGNNVNMELEMNAMRENRLTYETYAAILESHLGLIDAAIREGH
jgi:flagellar basal body rod protein FlgB